MSLLRVRRPAVLVAAINALERNLRTRFPQIQHLSVEPDEARGPTPR